MSGQFVPDSDAQPVSPWNIVFLSSRDLSAQIPVNFVTHPGVYLTPACFANGTYDGTIGEKCISNLLAAQFRRLILDLYWNSDNGRFSFCPVAIPGNASSSLPTSSVSAGKISSVSLGRSTSTALVARQTTSAVGTPTSGSSPNATSSSSSAPIPTFSNWNGETLYQLGPYQCSPTLDLDFFISIMLDYVQKTSDTINAKLIYLELNLHAAASSSAPSGPAAQPPESNLPSPQALVGAQFSSALGSYIYQPSHLQSDRSNLNDTWFRNPSTRWPIAGYMGLETMSDGDLATRNGWPDENYVQLSEAMRLFLSWGSIDPQMANYNFSSDAATIFAPGVLQSPHPFTANGDGQVTAGCFYNPIDTNVATINPSWAVSSDANAAFGNPSLVSNMTSCGISPILNQSYALPASDDIVPFTSIAQAAVWNWAAGEPRNVSAPGVDLDAPESQYRCAYFKASEEGRWHVEDCQHSYTVACQVNNEPYQWQLSSDQANFGTAPYVCPNNTSFSVPRTGLENTYLYHHILSEMASSNTHIDGVWINFNSLDVQGCWVTSGPNGTCPYFEDPNKEQSRQVLIPTISAIIILILTALTIFVKCNVNRRNSKARRRGEGGWDYEGVPS